MGYMNVHISRHLKEKLAWAIDERLQVISYIMSFKTVICTTKKIKPFYRIERQFGGWKHWQIWQITINLLKCLQPKYLV